MATAGFVFADDQPLLILEVEAGPTWQSSNDVQVSNTLEGTRFPHKNGDRWRLRIGGSLKVRDAKIQLRRGDTTSKDGDVG